MMNFADNGEETVNGTFSVTFLFIEFCVTKVPNYLEVSAIFRIFAGR